MKPAVLGILPWFRDWKTYRIKIKEKMEGVKKILTVGGYWGLKKKKKHSTRLPRPRKQFIFR